MQKCFRNVHKIIRAMSGYVFLRSKKNLTRSTWLKNEIVYNTNNYEPNTFNSIHSSYLDTMAV